MVRTLLLVFLFLQIWGQTAMAGPNAPTAACPASSMGAASGVGVPPAKPIGQLTPVDRPAALAMALGLPLRFALGVGSVEVPVVQAQNIKADIYDRYLGMAWPTWNSPPGAYVGVVGAQADCLGAVPMFTLYQMAANGDGNLSVLSNTTFMAQYWSNVRLLFQQLAAYGKPALVNFEPDFWGYTQRLNPDPSRVYASVSASSAGECVAQPDSLVGLAACLVQMARTYAPNARVGFTGALFGDTVAFEPAYLLALGAAKADFVAITTLDRDIGCIETHNLASNCNRPPSPDTTIWDATNTTTPNFAQHLAVVAKFTQTLGLPAIWWQTPLGVVSATPGGSVGAFRDNRVDYFTRHADELAAVGGMAAVFSPGDIYQTSLSTDGGNFQRLSAAYQSRPVALALTCSYTFGTSALFVPGSAGSTSVSLSAPSGCAWTATSARPWVSITSGASGSGAGNIGFSFAANPSASTRTATLTVAGQLLTVTQSAANAIAVGAGGAISGKAGVTNVAVFGGALAAYAVSVNSGSGVVQVTDSVAGRNATSQLSNIQRAQFSDLNLAFDTSTPFSAGGIYRLYAAAFNRVPDLAGLGYWIYQADLGMGGIQMATGFTYSQEFQRLFGVTISDNFATGANLTSLVTGFYQNVLHRLPEPAGLAFWVDQLQTRNRTLGQVLAEFADSPENRAQVAAQLGNGVPYQPWHE